MVVVNWCEHGQEFIPWPEADDYCDVGACPASPDNLASDFALGEPDDLDGRIVWIALRNSPIRE
jgi:hypothetical protein